MIKSGLLLSAGNICVVLLSLVRNVLIARLISVEDFGIASTFAITTAMVEMASYAALDRLIVQAKDGDTPAMQATAQTIQAIRGVLGAAVLFALAGPLASLFNIPEVKWAYQAMAAIPLLRGLAHLDMFRLQRELRFLPSITVEFAGLSVSTAAAIFLALELQDFRAMLYALLLQQLVYTVVSHAVAVRPYRWGLDLKIVRRAIAFGWPLLLNGFLLFGIFQGDRVIVGSLISMHELGLFSAAFMLAFVPTLVISKTLRTFFLPQISRVQEDVEEFNHLFLVISQATMLIGVLFAVAFAIAGPALMIAFYGAKYEAVTPLLVWLAVVQTVRLARVGPTVTALSKAQTKNPMISNMVRVSMLMVTWILLRNGGELLTVVLVGLIGESLALLVSFFILTKENRLPISGLYFPLIFGILSLIIICSDTAFWDIRFNYITNFNYIQIILAMFFLSMLFFMPELRRWFVSLVRTK